MTMDASMSEPTDPEVVVLTAADGEVFALRRSQLAAFRVPAEERDELLAALASPEVGGFTHAGGLHLTGTLQLTTPRVLPGDAVLPPTSFGHGDIAFPGDAF